MPSTQLRTARPFITLLAALLSVGIPAGAPDAHSADDTSALADVTQRLEAGDPLVFASFGDSITWPCYHTDFRQNYLTLVVDALRRAYPRARIEIVHAGNMGSAGRGLAESRFDRYVLAKRPDVVFIMFGMNDCGGGPAGLDSYDRNLTQLIDKTRHAGAVPVILTQNEIIYDCPDGTGRRALPLYMQRAIEVARREHVPFADCFADWQPLKNNRDALVARLNDWIHPNLAGHRLFAKSIVTELWPEAAQYVETDVRPQSTWDATPCLVAGPPGKQLLRTDDGSWFAIWGRRRGERISDLVISFTRVERPEWNDFAHVTLIGPADDALFADDDKDITAAMLALHETRLFVLFSWNTGVFLLSIDVGDPDWTERITTADAWKDLESDPFRRPHSIINSEMGDGRLFDAAVDSNGTAVLCRTRQKAPGAGWEVLDGEDGIALVIGSGDARKVDFRFPSYEFAQFGRLKSGDEFIVARKEPTASLLVGILGQELNPVPLNGQYVAAMPHLADFGYALAIPASGRDAKPMAITWRAAEAAPADVGVIQTHVLEQVSCDAAPFPAIAAGEPACIIVPREANGDLPRVCYESWPREGAMTAGALIERGGELSFAQLPLHMVLGMRNAD